MARFKDTQSAGPSRECPFIPGEPAMVRHARRKKRAFQDENRLREYCRQNRYDLEIKNEGHHWIISRGREQAEWWPSSAKLVFNKEWRKGIHCYTVQKVMEQCDKMWSPKPQLRPTDREPVEDINFNEKRRHGSQGLLGRFGKKIWLSLTRRSGKRVSRKKKERGGRNR